MFFLNVSDIDGIFPFLVIIMILYIDTETRSDVDIERGVKHYINSPEFKILLISYAIDDAYPKVCTVDTIPEELWNALNSDCTIVMHNSAFDVEVLRNVIDIPYSRVHDTMIQASACGHAHALAYLSLAYNLGEEGKQAGGRLINTFCKPVKRSTKKKKKDINEENKTVFLTEKDKPELWEEFVKYAIHDIISMRKLYKLMPKYNYPNGKEYQHWLINRRINKYGIKVDMDFVNAAIEQIEEYKKELSQDFFQLTGFNPTQREEYKKFIESKGFDIKDTTSQTIKSLLSRDDLDLDFRHVLELQQGLNSAAVAKYKSVKKTAYNGILHECLEFLGAARTGRDAGKKVQPQNFKRPEMFSQYKDNKSEDEAIEKAVQTIKQKGVKQLGNPYYVFSNMVRNIIIPRENNKLVVVDLSNIEGRILSWLAGETWKVEAFADFDSGKTEFDNYVLAYSRAMQVPPQNVTKDMRAIGKVMELGLGYGGGPKAFSKMANSCKLNLTELSTKIKQSLKTSRDLNIFNDLSYYNEDLGMNKFEYKGCNYLKIKWRRAHPNISNFWRELNIAFRFCIKQQNVVQYIGQYIKMVRRDEWVKIGLPSGRVLYYFKPYINRKNEIKFIDGFDKTTKDLIESKTYGGKLSENVTSAVARDVLYQSLQKIIDKGYKPVLLVHDEIVAEAPIDPQFNGDDLAKLMSLNQEWNQGLPLAAQGFETFRYKGK